MIDTDLWGFREMRHIPSYLPIASRCTILRQSCSSGNIYNFKPVECQYFYCKCFKKRGIIPPARGVNKDSVEGVNIKNFFYPPRIFLPPLEKYHDVYQIIGFSWVWFEFSTHFWHSQTPSNKGFIFYLSAFTFHYSHSFYINYKDL